METKIKVPQEEKESLLKKAGGEFGKAKENVEEKGEELVNKAKESELLKKTKESEPLEKTKENEPLEKTKEKIGSLKEEPKSLVSNVTEKFPGKH